MANDFSSLGIRDEVTSRLMAMGLFEPTPIQEQAIPLVLGGKDLIGQAQTGTGKTLAFVLPILEKIEPEQSAVQALIITPTRELALQITTEVKKLADAVGAQVVACYGGQDVVAQVKKLKGASHIVVGTPGRLLDHFDRGTLDLGDVKVLVLDEADQMLHMGFLREVEAIMDRTSFDRQTLLFSATMPAQVRQVAKRYLKKPKEIKVESPKITLDEIEQLVVETTDRFKKEAVMKLVDRMNPYLAVIFCRTKKRASALNEALQQEGYESDELHGDLTQAKREKVMKRFRDAKLQLLVATDVAARGLDVEGVTHVFNYDIPHDVESYIHRIGRTGRAGEQGVAVTFIAPKDRDFMKMIELGINQRLPRQTPEGDPVQFPPRRDDGEEYGRRDDREGRGGRGGRNEGRGDGRGQGQGQGKGKGYRQGGGQRDDRGGRSYEGRGGQGQGRPYQGGGQKDDRGGRDFEGRGGQGQGRGYQGGGQRDDRGGRSYEGRGGQGQGRSYQGGGQRDDRGGRSYEGRGDQGQGRPYQGGGQRDDRGGRSYEGRGGGQGQGRPYQGGDQRDDRVGRSYEGRGGGQGQGKPYQGGGQRDDRGGRSYEGRGGGQGQGRSYQGGGQRDDRGGRSYEDRGGQDEGRSYQGGGQRDDRGGRSYEGRGGQGQGRPYQGGGQRDDRGGRFYEARGGEGQSSPYHTQGAARDNRGGRGGQGRQDNRSGNRGNAGKPSFGPRGGGRGR